MYLNIRVISQDNLLYVVFESIYKKEEVAISSLADNISEDKDNLPRNLHEILCMSTRKGYYNYDLDKYIRDRILLKMTDFMSPTLKQEMLAFTETKPLSLHDNWEIAAVQYILPTIPHAMLNFLAIISKYFNSFSDKFESVKLCKENIGESFTKFKESQDLKDSSLISLISEVLNFKNNNLKKYHAAFNVLDKFYAYYKSMRKEPNVLTWIMCLRSDRRLTSLFNADAPKLFNPEIKQEEKLSIPPRNYFHS